VIHSELTERKFIEVQKALGAAEAMVITMEHFGFTIILSSCLFTYCFARFKILQDVDHCEPNSKSKQAGYRINGKGY
jgi:hypothetical protein